MKILITGGAGFIGSHLAEAFLNQGNEVYIIDDLSTGALDNIKHLQENKEQRENFFVTIDTVLNLDKMVELVGTCDWIFHLAAAVGVQYILENPLSSIVTNVRGTGLVLELCNKFKKKVLLASTSEIYGKQTHAPLLESDNCVYGPSTKSRWSYAASKLIDEFTALAYYRTKGLPVIIARLFNTVGPRQTGRYGMVVPRFVKKALANEAINVYGDGTQTRTFTHVLDVVEFLMKIIDTPEAVGEVINIGGTEEISIMELARRVKEKAQSHSEINRIPYTQIFPKDFEDMLRRVPSIEKLKRLTGLEPTRGIEQILDDVITYFRQN